MAITKKEQKQIQKEVSEQSLSIFSVILFNNQFKCITHHTHSSNNM